MRRESTARPHDASRAGSESRRTREHVQKERCENSSSIIIGRVGVVV